MNLLTEKLNYLNVLGLVVLIPLLSACSALTGYPTAYRDNNAMLAADQPFLAADVREKGNAPSDTLRGGLTKKQYRDTVVYRRLEIIDSFYYDFESTLTGTYNGLAIGGDLTTLALNGLGATVGGASAKAALAAASAGVIGAKSAVNTDIFYQKTLPAFVAQMRAARQDILLKIETGITQSADSYSLDQALSDVNAYYIAGSLPSAVSQFVTQAGAKASVAQSGMDSLRKMKYRPNSVDSEKLISWLHPDGDASKPPDPDRLAKLSAWMAKYKGPPDLSGLPYELLLNGDNKTLDPALSQAVKDLLDTQ